MKLNRNSKTKAEYGKNSLNNLANNFKIHAIQENPTNGICKLSMKQKLKHYFLLNLEKNPSKQFTSSVSSSTMLSICG